MGERARISDVRWASGVEGAHDVQRATVRAGRRGDGLGTEMVIRGSAASDGHRDSEQRDGPNRTSERHGREW